MKRIDALREKMVAQSMPALLVTNQNNIYYLTGFWGSAGTVLITPDKAILYTDARYTGLAREVVDGTDIELVETRAPLTEIEKLKLESLAFDPEISYGFYQLLTKLNLPLIEARDMVEELRMIKDEDEIAIIKHACEIADRAYEDLLKWVEVGKTEIEVANFLDFQMRKYDASGVSFETIVASGKNSAMPHARATNKPIEFGDIVTVDFGCYYKHYASDMTRTFFMGEADPKLVEIYNVVLDANKALIEQAKAGMSRVHFDKVPRDVIEAAGYGPNFTHGIGHGLGLDVHEVPYFSATTPGTIEAGMVLTDEPGIYIDGFGGVRIEDDLLITADGVEVLTNAPKELTIID
jgi:Xaa-Pro aminopeptidase